MKKKSSTGLIATLIIVIVAIIGTLGYYFFLINDAKETLTPMYLASEELTVNVYDEEFNVVPLVRATEVQVSDQTKEKEDIEYIKFYLNEKIYYTDQDIFVDSKDDSVLEKELFVSRTCSIYVNDSSSEIKGIVYKGEKIDITGHSSIKEDGSVDRYKYKDGYVLTKYLVKSKEEAESPSLYDKYHKDIYSYDNGQGASGMDYFENEKPSFEDNVMPDIVKAIYINDKAIYELDDYIDLAKSMNINALIIDIRDSHVITVKADTFKKYSTSAYNAGLFEKDEFIKMIKKVKDAGLYAIARITAFQDTNYALDHPEECILDLSEGGKPLIYGDATWPTAYSRNVWQYNVELSKECITDLGFNEIQYDYVRFPEQVDYYADKLQVIDLQNKYNESRSEAIQRFLMYAADEIHSVHGYLAACVFGETSNNYVAAYGQYWPAISSVVDVICPMPYPDHFNPHEYGINDCFVWENPYRLLSAWASDAKKRQEEIPSPAKVRSWIQGYNSIKEPLVIYDANKISEQINALKDANLYDGFMCWNVLSDYEKLKSFKEAFEKG